MNEQHYQAWQDARAAWLAAVAAQDAEPSEEHARAEAEALEVEGAARELYVNGPRRAESDS